MLIHTHTHVPPDDYDARETQTTTLHKMTHGPTDARDDTETLTTTTDTTTMGASASRSRNPTSADPPTPQTGGKPRRRSRKWKKNRHLGRTTSTDSASTEPLPTPRATPYSQTHDAHELYAHDEELLELQVAVATTRAATKALLRDAEEWRARALADGTTNVGRGIGGDEDEGGDTAGENVRGRGRGSPTLVAATDRWNAEEGGVGVGSRFLGLEFFDPRERDMRLRVSGSPVGRGNGGVNETETMRTKKGYHPLLESSLDLEKIRLDLRDCVTKNASAFQDIARTFAEKMEKLQEDSQSSFEKNLESLMIEHERNWFKHKVAREKFTALTEVVSLEGSHSGKDAISEEGSMEEESPSLERSKQIDAISTEISQRVAAIEKNEVMLKTRSREFLAYFVPHARHLAKEFAMAQVDFFGASSERTARAVASSTIESLRREMSTVKLPSRTRIDAPPTPDKLGSESRRKQHKQKEEESLEEGEIAVSGAPAEATTSIA